MKHLHILFFLAALLLLSACRTAKEISGTGYTPFRGSESAATTGGNKSDHAAKATARLVEGLTKTRIDNEALTASAKVQIVAKGKELSVNGQLRMKRNDCIRLSLRFIGMEVGLMEFTPEDALILDRVNKQYVRARYDEVPFLQGAGLDFYALQSLFWNELFVPGKREGLSAADFQAGRDASQLVSTPANGSLRYTFTTKADGNVPLISALHVESTRSADRTTFDCNYSDFRSLPGRTFPHLLQLSVGGVKTPISLGLQLSSLKADANWNPRTTVSSRYTRRTVAEVLKGLNL